MAVDMFLKIEGVEGESKDKTHKGAIQILAYSFGMSQSGSFHSGSGGGSGKVNVQDISITKYVDKSSKRLMEVCAGGDPFDKASIIVRKAGSTPLEYLKINLEPVIVTSISTGGSGGEEQLTENVSLNFAKISYSYFPQKPEGGADAAMEFSYDIAANESGA